jgi:hypothetical protein
VIPRLPQAATLGRIANCDVAVFPKNLHGFGEQAETIAETPMHADGDLSSSLRYWRDFRILRDNGVRS